MEKLSKNYVFKVCYRLYENSQYQNIRKGKKIQTFKTRGEAMQLKNSILLHGIKDSIQAKLTIPENVKLILIPKS